MKKLSVALAVVLALASCKKDPNIHHSPVGGGGDTPVSGPITPSRDTSFYGFLTFSKTVFVPQSFLSFIAISYSASAEFVSTPQSGHSTLTNLEAVNSVEIDNDPLAFNATSINYQTTSSPMDTTCHWQVVGLNNIPSFNYTSTKGFLGNTNFSSYLIAINDTIYRSQPLTVQFGSINTKGLHVIVSDGVHTVSHSVAAGITSYTFPVGALAPLANSANSDGYILITMENDDIESVSGKPMKFAFVSNFKRTIYVRP